MTPQATAVDEAYVDEPPVDPTTVAYKFPQGRHIYALKIFEQTVEVECALCTGTGRVQIVGSEQTVLCPDCRSGRVSTPNKQTVYDVEHISIRTVKLSVTVRGMSVSYEDSGGYWHSEDSLFWYYADARKAAVKAGAQPRRVR